MSRRKVTLSRGCTDGELVEVLAAVQGQSVPPAYIDFLVERGVGPEIFLHRGARWILYYPTLLEIPALVAGRLRLDNSIFPVALEAWDEGSPVFSAEWMALYGFVADRPGVQRLDHKGLKEVAASFPAWLESLGL